MPTPVAPLNGQSIILIHFNMCRGIFFTLIETGESLAIWACVRTESTQLNGREKSLKTDLIIGSVACRVAFCLSSFLFRTYKNCLNHQIKYHNEYKKRKKKRIWRHSLVMMVLYNWPIYLYIFHRNDDDRFSHRVEETKTAQQVGKKMKTKIPSLLYFGTRSWRISRKIMRSGQTSGSGRADRAWWKKIFILFSFRPFNPHDI